jgi:replicative DNA helicase
LLAHLIGDGCVLPRHAIQYTTQNDKLANTVAELARTVFTNQLVPRVQQERSWYQVYLPAAQHLTHGIRNPISEWFETLGIFGLRSHEKFVPEVVFQQPEDNIAVFLRHLWSTDGCINMRNGKRPYPAIFYASSSKKLAYGVQTLLLHLGINARVKQQAQGKKGRDQFHVIISGQEDVLLFVDLVGTVGSYRVRELQEIRNHISTRISNTNRDVIPHTVWRQQVVPAMQAQGITTRQMQADISQPYCGTSLYKQNVSRARIERVAQAVNSTELDNLAKSDVYWDKVVAVEPLGEEEVFDLTVPGPHNFIANNIIVHNSIEQDADIVMFIYRDEYYNGDTSERPNIAEIHIAKHRNGPTGTIDLFWHEKLATFRNLQRQEINL